MAGEDNPTFVRDELDSEANVYEKRSETFTETATKKDQSADGDDGRDSWGKGIEFLFSCIALSVGLGNIWRFPFVALGKTDSRRASCDKK
jgi:Sodium:neurotransmitter symporter family